MRGKIHYKKIKKEQVTSKIIYSFIHPPWVVIQPSHPLNGHEFEQTLGDSEEQGSLVKLLPEGVFALLTVDVSSCNRNRRIHEV